MRRQKPTPPVRILLARRGIQRGAAAAGGNDQPLPTRNEIEIKLVDLRGKLNNFCETLRAHLARHVKDWNTLAGVELMTELRPVFRVQYIRHHLNQLYVEKWLLEIGPPIIENQ